jgi:hypothetical protein
MIYWILMIYLNPVVDLLPLLRVGVVVLPLLHRVEVALRLLLPLVHEGLSLLLVVVEVVQLSLLLLLLPLRVEVEEVEVI